VWLAVTSESQITMSLQTLASHREAPVSSTEPRARSKKLTDRLIAGLPLYLLAGFLALGWVLFGEYLVPRRSVEVATVVTQRASVDAGVAPADNGASAPNANPWAGAPLFQASGWIEADPFPTRATALVGGVVESVHVLEGERVAQGQPLATLIREDMEIALREAQGRLAEARAQVKQERVKVQQVEAALATNASRVAAAEARLRELLDEADRLNLGGAQAFSEREIEQAKLKVATGRAEVDAVRARETELAREVEAQKLAAETAERRVEVAEAAVARAELDLNRTEIRSPIGGVVQQLFVAPGKRRMLQMDNPEAATVAILFDPASLQARIDVPLEEAAQLFVGQPVIVRTNLLPDRRFKGRVTRIVGMADIQRNTLQAKVALEDPDPLLRPEMLCRAEFLSGSQGTQETDGALESGSSGRVTVFVPEKALVDREGADGAVWTLDAGGEKAERRGVTLGASAREGFLEVADGLRPGDPVILNPPPDLKPGERVQANQP